MSANARTLFPVVYVPSTDVDSRNGFPSSVGTGPLSFTIDVVAPVNAGTLRSVLRTFRFPTHASRALGPRNRAGSAAISAYTSCAAGPAAAVPARFCDVPRG
jgi:hypothetical protein